MGRPRWSASRRRGSENSAHRGSRGASLKRRARDAGEKADLRFLLPDGGLGRDRCPASISRDVEARGSVRPPASRAPSDFFRWRIGRTARTHPRRENDGGWIENRIGGWQARAASALIPPLAGRESECVERTHHENANAAGRVVPRAASAANARCQLCQNIASSMTIGSGMPMSHSNKPLPTVMVRSCVVARDRKSVV